MSTLFELTGARLELQNKLEAMDFDEVTIADTLESDSTELAEKITDYGYVIKNRTSFADAMTAEIVRMTARRDAELKRIANIEQWLLTNMQGCGITKIECPAFTVQVKVNPASVEVLDEAAIPPEYLRTPEPKPPVPAPDKRAILEALKLGVPVSGCAIKHTSKLVIK